MWACVCVRGRLYFPLPEQDHVSSRLRGGLKDTSWRDDWVKQWDRHEQGGRFLSVFPHPRLSLHPHSGPTSRTQWLGVFWRPRWLKDGRWLSILPFATPGAEQEGWNSRSCLAVLFLLFRRSVVSDGLWPHGLQHARLPCPSPSPRACSNACLLSWWCHPTSRPLLSPSPPAFYLPQHQEAKGLELQLQHQSFQWIFRVDFHLDWLVWSPCSPKDSQESSPTPQFESINSSALSLLNGSALTSIHDYWSLAVRKS